MNILLLGAPGAGKGTQAKILQDHFGLVHLASGDLFRANVKDGTELGKIAQSYLDAGQLVPDELVNKMMISTILARLQTPDQRGQGIMLDGFPRNLPQAKALDTALKSQNCVLDRVIYVKVPFDVLVARAVGRYICKICQTPYHISFNPPKVTGICDRDGGELYQRSDDTETVVRERIKVYLEETAPLISYYLEEGILFEIDGQKSIEEVTKTLDKSLKQA